MRILIIKEIRHLIYSSGYWSVIVLTVIFGLFLWIFDNELNIVNGNVANLDSFFFLAPWIYILFTSVFTIDSFSGEYRNPSVFILHTLPFTNRQIVLSKFFALWSFLASTLITSLVYVYSINQLALPAGNIQIGVLFGSYIGLFFCLGFFTSIGLFSSCISSNWVNAFGLSIFMNFFFYYGWQAMGSFSLFGSWDYWVQNIGIQAHYQNLSIGLLRFADLLYFIVGIVFFLFLTVVIKNPYALKRRKWKIVCYGFLSTILISLGIGSVDYWDLDLTEDKRYTLSDVSKKIVSGVEHTIYIENLLTGNLPSGFRQLKIEFERLIKNIQKENHLIFYDEFDLQGASDESKEFYGRIGIKPTDLQLKTEQGFSSRLIYPWAVIDAMGTKGRIYPISLLNQQINVSANEQLQNSIESQEFYVIQAIQKLVVQNKPTIAFLTGHSELDDSLLADFKNELFPFYRLTTIDLDSIDLDHYQPLNDSIDLLIIAKPKNPLTEPEKYQIDQYIMSGGRTLWMLDMVDAEMSYLSDRSEMIAQIIDLNLTDMLFRYGVRVNPVLVRDAQAAPIKLAIGQTGNRRNYSSFPWSYFPLAFAKSNHPIVNQINGVKFEFANSIDVLSGKGVKQHILLETSQKTYVQIVPSQVHFQSLNNPNQFHNFIDSPKVLAVALEGSFTSAYKNRIKPLKFKENHNASKATKMIVISDGDLAKNQLHNGQPLPLGYDKWTNQSYGNKEFLLNCVHWLAGQEELLALRQKNLKQYPLDKKKLKGNKIFWQMLNIGMPILVLLLFGTVHQWIRRHRYKRP